MIMYSFLYYSIITLITHSKLLTYRFPVIQILIIWQQILGNCASKKIKIITIAILTFVKN